MTAIRTFVPVTWIACLTALERVAVIDFMGVVLLQCTNSRLLWILF